MYGLIVEELRQQAQKRKEETELDTNPRATTLDPTSSYTLVLQCISSQLSLLRLGVIISQDEALWDGSSAVGVFGTNPFLLPRQA